jgi:NADH:ubiquinone oxidoreductase subunit 2 (subunit N)
MRVRTSRVRNRGGALRRRIRSSGRTSKQRAQGEIRRRRTRRMRGMAIAVVLEEVKELPTDGRVGRERIRLGGAWAGVAIRREGKNGSREKIKRRTSGDYRRRLIMGRRGAVVRRERGDRRERYLGRERRALSTYVLVGYRRGSAYATEAGRKYFRVGARASTRLVRGIARIYGETGTIRREERGRRNQRREEGTNQWQEQLGRRRMRWVRRFKRGSMPVHRWVADIYEGAPTMAGRYLRIVPKRGRRRVRVRRIERVAHSSVPTVQTVEYKSVELITRRRWVCGRGSVIIGGRGRRVQRRWKRYMAYSGIGNVGNLRRGGRRRTSQGIKGIRRTLRTYMRIVRRRWGGRRRRGVLRRAHEGRPGRQGAQRRERKYTTERRGRGKENPAMARTRTAGRMSRVGRPPRLGFGAKRSVIRARVEKGRRTGEAQYRERGGRSLRMGMVAAYGYLRRVKRRRMEEIREGEGKRSRRQRKVEKEGARRRGRVRRRRTLAWRNGEGVERRRERRGREVRKRVI